MQGIIEITQTNTTEARRPLPAQVTTPLILTFRPCKPANALSFRQLLDVAGSARLKL